MGSKMAFVIENPSKGTLRAVIQFLAAEGRQPKEIYKSMKDVYGDCCYSYTAVAEWCSKFRQGRESTKDLARPGPARAATSEENVRQLELTLRTNRRVKVRELAQMLGISIGTVHSIINGLGYQKVADQWTPRLLKDEQKKNRLNISLQHLLRYQQQGNKFLNKIVTGDEYCCYHFEPGTKGPGTVPRKRGRDSPKAKKSRSQPHVGKVMLTVFLDYQGVLLLEFRSPNVNVTTEHFAETLHSLQDNIANSRPGKLKDGVILLHDSIHIKDTDVVQKMVESLNWELLKHPPTSPDLSPCEFHVFGPLKQALKGRRFNSDEETEAAVREWFDKRPQEFFQQAIYRLAHQWDGCVKYDGDFS
ncbi:hypothetical protein GWI33_014804 [Rhynchophorus ferrugineus]|uniref:Mos1 transposase HTH domain-containing protein n=1 Tax=Rhynchophorus ferrugineus TaxID=354439 RepID=A0A834I0Q5_RHYFE|nr:hypothetical protein GWI33_014804 [Rhynchophorus ferrugineus]